MVEARAFQTGDARPINLRHLFHNPFQRLVDAHQSAQWLEMLLKHGEQLTEMQAVVIGGVEEKLLGCDSSDDFHARQPAGAYHRSMLAWAPLRQRAVLIRSLPR